MSIKLRNLILFIFCVWLRHSPRLKSPQHIPHGHGAFTAYPCKKIQEFTFNYNYTIDIYV